MPARQHRRVDVLGSPWQWTVLPVGDPRRTDRYRRLELIARVNIPRRIPESSRALITTRIRDDLIGRVTFS